MGQCSFGPNPSTKAPATELTADLVEEILLRFPHSEPASLVRATLVCKQWRRLISKPRFRRRFREFHRRTPPMLGFFCSILAGDDGVETAARFVPTSTYWSPRADDLRHCRAIDARHGRVLLMQCPGGGKASSSSKSVLVVWVPVSDERRELPVPTRWGRQASRWPFDWNAAVLCAAAADGPCDCDHLDCHRGPFLVVFVDSHPVCDIFVSTYSSDNGAWSDRIFQHHPFDYFRVSSSPCAHVGNALYFASETSGAALKYDLCLQETSLISIPSQHCLVFPYVLTTTEDGSRLRYTVLHRSKLYMWSRAEGGPEVVARRQNGWTQDGVIARRHNGWTQDGVIELKMLLCNNAIWSSPRIVGFADGASVIFLTADDVLFTVDINTKEVKKVSKDITVDKALPYMSFYTPANGTGGRSQQPVGGHQARAVRRLQTSTSSCPSSCSLAMA